MTLPRGLERIERSALHYAVAERICREVLESDPEVSGAALAQYLFDNITSTRSVDDRLALVGACVAQLPQWRRRLATRMQTTDLTRRTA